MLPCELIAGIAPYEYLTLPDILRGRDVTQRNELGPMGAQSILQALQTDRGEAGV